MALDATTEENAMIPASGRYIATYTDTDGVSPPDRQVEAFDDEGRALVLADTGRLEPAASLPGFAAIHRRPAIVAVLPPGGWTVQDDDDPEGTRPIAGWLVDENGETLPLLVDEENGYAHPPDGPVRLRQPVEEGA
ncbi:hypothetical protein GA0074692_3450 [Micromonospora pallida]|uniref:Uncharacterized protein n=1 Tax=Micromonospora pallida TaxID=145854 RepID=A0A1C6STV3_9ACTN|nr:hypothetical protein [Micromonospora pallida]SCL32940.1 hypothetical protein GA0074692_3450 [Micromonospora pallida]